MAKQKLLLGMTYAAVSLLSGCAIRPSTAATTKPTVMVKSVRLPVRNWLPWFRRFAEHTWIDFHHAGTWHRAEWDDVDHIIMSEMSAARAFADVRWGREVAVHEQFSGNWTVPVTAKILEIA
jgi:hypothetical protein